MGQTPVIAGQGLTDYFFNMLNYNKTVAMITNSRYSIFMGWLIMRTSLNTTINPKSQLAHVVILVCRSTVQQV